jgi:NitT/TauT family transport system substrate-binding protein
MMSLTKRSLLGALVGLAAIGLSVATTEVTAQENKLTVMVDWAPHGMHAALHLAVEKGWFEEAGIDVTVLDGKGSTSTIQQTGAGQIDVGFAQLSAMAVARSQGMPVVSIACFVRGGDNGVMVPAGMGYNTLQDLKGKKIAYAAASTTGPFLDAFLQAGGVSREDFEIINVDAASLVSTYTSGAADAVMSTVAFFMPIVQSSRPTEGILWADVGLRLPGYGLVVTPTTLEQKDEALRKLVQVQVRTWDYIFAGNEDEAVAAIIAQRPNERLDPEVLKGQLVAYMKLFDTPATAGKSVGWQSEEDWAAALTAMEDANVLEPGTTPSEYFTNKYFE